MAVNLRRKTADSDELPPDYPPVDAFNNTYRPHLRFYAFARRRGRSPWEGDFTAFRREGGLAVNLRRKTADSDGLPPDYPPIDAFDDTY